MGTERETDVQIDRHRVTEEEIGRDREERKLFPPFDETGTEAHKLHWGRKRLRHTQTEKEKREKERERERGGKKERKSDTTVLTS